MGGFVFDTLKKKYPGKVLINPTSEIYHLYWYDDMIVIEKLVSEVNMEEIIVVGKQFEARDIVNECMLLKAYG